MRLPKFLISISVILFAVVVPFLEVNDSHVFNPHWTPHARLHEVWQLFTNCAIGALCLWLVWFRGKIQLGGILSLIVMGGFLLAFILRDIYGGSMVFHDGTETRLLGMNIGILGFGLGSIFVIVGMWLHKKSSFTS